jgi:Flp pilus assembly protein TadB
MAGALVLGAGLLLVGYLLFDEVYHAASPEFRRRVDNTVSLVRRLSWTTFIPLPLTFFIAFLMRDGILIFVYMVALGIALTYYLAERALRQEEVRLDEEIAKLVESFRNVYRIRPAIFSALAEARTKVRDPLRSYVTTAVETFYVTSSQARAFSELRERSDNPYLNQFIYILERIEAARQEAIINALQNLIDRLRRREELRRQTEIDLTVITAQTRIILIISILIIVAIAVIAPLRRVYTDSAMGQFVFVFVVSIAAYTAYRIDRRVMDLKERVL